jgi:dCMP deaminase
VTTEKHHAGSNRTARWDARFIALCDHISGWSKEEGKRVGSVIVGPWDEIRSTGFNGFPRGVNDDDSSRHDRESGSKYIWSSHAERNAIFNAARVGIPLFGCRIYSNYFPCVECAKAIIQSGLSAVISRPPDLTDSRWADEFKTSIVLFDEAGIECRFESRPEDGTGSFKR